MSVPADRTVRAVCHRCGGPKKGPLIPCKTCSFTPTGDPRSLPAGLPAAAAIRLANKAEVSAGPSLLIKTPLP